MYGHWAISVGEGVCIYIKNKKAHFATHLVYTFKQRLKKEAVSVDCFWWFRSYAFPSFGKSYL